MKFKTPPPGSGADDQGQILFNQVVQPWKFVRIPATRVIVELDLDAEVNYLLQINRLYPCPLLNS